MKLKKLPKDAKPFDKMAIAIAEYIGTIGGTAVVVGGVKIGTEIGARKFNYFIQIGITGKMPTEGKSYGTSYFYTKEEAYRARQDLIARLNVPV